jgi:hypothetical protein
MRRKAGLGFIPPHLCPLRQGKREFSGRRLFSLTPALSDKRESMIPDKAVIKEEEYSPSPQSSPLKGEEDYAEGIILQEET